jgi:hypothetical protein
MVEVSYWLRYWNNGKNKFSQFSLLDGGLLLSADLP